MSKEQKIRKFIKEIEAITSSKVIGFDFIALGDDDGYYYQDYLLHSKQKDSYLKVLDDNYFNSNPSLLLTGLKERIKSVYPSSKTNSKRINLTYSDLKIPKDNFTKETTLKKSNDFYWNTWCKIISDFYTQCKSIYFIKEGFNNLVQTTALFIYFNSDITILNKRDKDWLNKASKVFLYEEAISVFLPMHIEKIEELQRLKTKTMLSLTTHSLKTHLNTTVIKTKNAFNKKLCSYPELKKLSFYPELTGSFIKHGKEVDTLFHLTELISLIDKIDKPKKFCESGINSKLLSTSVVNYYLKKHLEDFNENHKADNKIELINDYDIIKISIPIYGLYFGNKLLELFFNTVFENVLAYGKPENRKKKLSIETREKYWKFSNAIVDKSFIFDEQQLKGNLKLFKKLIEETKSGIFSIPSPDNYEFKIEIHEQNYSFLD